MRNGQAKHLQLCEACIFLWCSRIVLTVNDNDISTHVLINSPTAIGNQWTPQMLCASKVFSGLSFLICDVVEEAWHWGQCCKSHFCIS